MEKCRRTPRSLNVSQLAFSKNVLSHFHRLLFTALTLSISMSNPARAGTHPPKVHFNGHPLSDKHRRATRMSSMTIHPQQSKAHLVNLGTKQHKSGNCSGSSSASPWVHPIPVPINHFWQVVGKQLLMIVLLWSAGSHLLTLPAVVCLPEP